MKKKLITLAKELDFEEEYEYYNYIYESWINGNKTQVTALYKQLRNRDKEEFVKDYLPNYGAVFSDEIKSHLLLN